MVRFLNRSFMKSWPVLIVTNNINIWALMNRGYTVKFSVKQKKIVNLIGTNSLNVKSYCHVATFIFFVVAIDIHNFILSRISIKWIVSHAIYPGNSKRYDFNLVYLYQLVKLLVEYYLASKWLNVWGPMIELKLASTCVVKF